MLLLLLLLHETCHCLSAVCCSHLKLAMDCLQGPEIRTGFLANPDKPVNLKSGKEITLTTDYEAKGTDDLIACRFGPSNLQAVCPYNAGRMEHLQDRPLLASAHMCSYKKPVIDLQSGSHAAAIHNRTSNHHAQRHPMQLSPECC